ncbi:unnamed protein product [Parnassius apollo]|uniref:(apollo) hypothetical protein n=1 Tax=Parnassius apollo TaxID=110799 RepID=A0A8S3XAM0_PARAO|nr:unnamed protein product [Parnassius apollo]
MSIAPFTLGRPDGTLRKSVGSDTFTVRPVTISVGSDIILAYYQVWHRSHMSARSGGDTRLPTSHPPLPCSRHSRKQFRRRVCREDTFRPYRQFALAASSVNSNTRQSVNGKLLVRPNVNQL